MAWYTAIVDSLKHFRHDEGNHSRAFMRRSSIDAVLNMMVDQLKCCDHDKNVEVSPTGDDSTYFASVVITRVFIERFIKSVRFVVVLACVS